MIGNLTGRYQLIAQLLYGSGSRINECLRLRVKDVDFGMNHIAVRDTKGHRDRVSILPELVRHKLKLQIDYVKSLHLVDLAEGAGEVYLPCALERKYPKAASPIANVIRKPQIRYLAMSSR